MSTFTTMQRLAERSAFAEQPILYLPECDSTMDEARAIVSGPADHGTIVTTDFQRKGRGRRAGRTWHAPAGSSLMFTLALYRPEHPARQSMQMALALAMLLESRYALAPQIKWPNDVLVSGKKIAGILADATGEWVYLGVGVNLTQDSFPQELADRAISLQTAVSLRAGTPIADALAAEVDEARTVRLSLLNELLANFTAIATGEVPFAAGIEARLWRRGQYVDVEQVGGAVVHGILVSVTSDGLLILGGQRRHELAAGEIHYAEGAATGPATGGAT